MAIILRIGGCSFHLHEQLLCHDAVIISYVIYAM